MRCSPFERNSDGPDHEFLGLAKVDLDVSPVDAAAAIPLDVPALAGTSRSSENVPEVRSVGVSSCVA